MSFQWACPPLQCSVWLIMRGRKPLQEVRPLACLLLYLLAACSSPACSTVGTCMMVSTWATTSLEDVGVANGSGLGWYQLYIYNNKQLTLEMVKRAEKAGYTAIVLTVDTPELGKRRTDMYNNFTLPPHLSLANFTDPTQSSLPSKAGSGLFNYTKALISPAVTWESVDWLRSVTSLPIVLKGILRAEDAKIALTHNVQGIVVSNHGARQLDGLPATVSGRLHLAYTYTHIFSSTLSWMHYQRWCRQWRAGWRCTLMVE